MKASFKAFVKEAAKLRSAIKDETLVASDIQVDLAASFTKLAALQGKLSELETDAAAHGLAVADLHAEVDKG